MFIRTADIKNRYKYYHVDTNKRRAQAIPEKVYRRWTDPTMTANDSFPEYWSINVNGPRGEENVAYFRHGKGANYSLLGSKLTSRGSDREDVIDMMSKIVKGHGVNIVDNDGVPSFMRIPTENPWTIVTPNNYSTLLLSPHPGPVRFVNEKLNGPFLWNPPNSGVTYTPATGTSRINCRELEKDRAKAKYGPYVWMNAPLEGGTSPDWSDMYAASSVLDPDKTPVPYALVVYHNDNDALYARRVDVYNKNTILPECKDSWQCEDPPPTGSSSSSPTKNSFHLTVAEKWTAVEKTDTVAAVGGAGKYTALKDRLISLGLLFLGKKTDLLKNSSMNELRVWNASSLFYYDGTNGWQTLGVATPLAKVIIESLNDSAQVSSNSGNFNSAGTEYANTFGPSSVAPTSTPTKIDNKGVDNTSSDEMKKSFQLAYFEKLFTP